MVADDDENDILMLTRALRKIGIEEPVQVCRDGEEVLEWLRNDPQRSVTPTIVLSASRQERDVLRAYKLGANSFFVKPTHVKQLENLLEIVCQYWLECERPIFKDC